MFKGKYVRVTALDEGFVELCFDREGDRINKLDRGTLTEVAEAATLIAARKDVRGVLDGAREVTGLRFSSDGTRRCRVA